ncbi:NfeD family protein [Desulfuromonas versatilis]|uniref:NfeD family protein n=1 Tax=Desulfuromonas versatilis TaxID=2802975 RepID=UPI001C84F41E|nr:NfeD family protein [Desulfuromonas versatilis]
MRLRVSPTLLKYALLQVPELALLATALLLVDHWKPLPGWLFWGVLGLWLAKDMALYPLLRNAYAPQDPATSDPMAGLRGIARERLAPSGYILVRGELWQAEIPEGAAAIEAGTQVRVLRTRNLTLLVEPADAPPASPPRQP